MMFRWVVAALLAAAAASPALAITGGVSVDDALNGEGTPEIQAMAGMIAEVTAPLVRVDDKGRVVSFCTSTLVHPRVALTASHCVFAGGEIFRGMHVLFPAGDGTVPRRQVLDAVIHPAIVAGIQAHGGDFRTYLRKSDNEFLMNDLALVLLHRPAPETHSIVEMVSPGFRDDRGIQKVIAGYGKVNFATQVKEMDLRFANLRGNTRDYRGMASGGSEIIMESYYRDGEKVNVCSGDSGGPVFVRERGGSRLRQIAVSSAADVQCRSYAVFAPIDAQRRALRRMFDDLMQGEQGADGNPF